MSDGRGPQKGYQPPKTDSKGQLVFHALGCKVNGGNGLPPGVCKKCASGSIVNQYYRSLMRIDQRAR